MSTGNINSYTSIRYSPEVATYDNTTTFRPNSTSSCLPVNTGTNSADFNVNGIHPYEPIEGMIHGIDEFSPALQVDFTFDTIDDDHVIPYTTVKLEGVIYSLVFGGGNTPGFDFFSLIWVLNILNPGSSNNIAQLPPTGGEIYLSGGQTLLDLSGINLSYTSGGGTSKVFNIRLAKTQAASTFVTYNLRYTLM
tara:strand:+ start:1780 stop:2358 length:579 start_codon:yes stop_codon:yes gene_type:complete